MGFDIYGEKLTPGHCEVHPWVHAEFPCPVCIEEHQREAQMVQNYENALWDEYERILEKEIIEENQGKDGDGI